MTVSILTGRQLALGMYVTSALVISAALVNAAAEPPKPKLAVVSDPDGAAADLKFQVDQPNLDAIFYIRNIGEDEADKLRLSAHLNETAHPRGAIVLKLTSEGNRLDDGSLTLAPGETIAIEMKVSGLPLGERGGYLLGEQSGRKFTVAPLQFTFAAEPLVKVIGLAEGATLHGTTSAGTFDHVFSIQSQNATPIQALAATITDATGPDGIQRKATIEKAQPGPTPISVKGHGIVELRVKTALPLAGIYTANISLSYDGYTREVPISITRTKMLMPYEMLAPDAVREEIPLGGTNTRIRVVFHELNGLRLSQEKLPELISLNSVSAGVKPYQIPIGGAMWSDDAGTFSTAIDLAPGESRALWLTLNGLGLPGEHSGTLRLSLPDGQSVTQSVSILARLHVGFAVFLIAAGIAISQCLKYLGQRSRNIQQLQQLSRIGRNARRIALTPEMTGGGRDVLKQLRSRVAILFSDTQSGRGQEISAQIVEIDRKTRMVPQWVALAKAVQSLRQPAAEWVTAVDRLRRFLLTDNSSKAEIENHEKLLSDTRDAVTKNLLDDLKSAIGETKQQVTRYLQRATTSQQSADRLASVRSLIDDAEDDYSRGHFENSQRKVDQASSGFAEVLIDDVRDLVQKPPAWLPEVYFADGWPSAVNRLNQGISQCQLLLRSDPNAAMQSAWRIRANYWSENFRLALEHMRGAAENGDATLMKSIEIFQGYASKLNTIITAPDIDPEAVLDFERKFQGAFAPAERPLDSKVGTATAASTEFALVSRFQVARLFPSAGTETVRLSDLRGIDSLQAWNGFWILLLSGVVALLLGLKLLWIDNPVWGTWNDCLVAILWGLGLHQVANASFDFNSHVHRLTKPSASDE